MAPFKAEASPGGEGGLSAESLSDSEESEAPHIQIDGLEPLAEGDEPEQRRGVSKLGIGKKSWTSGEDDILTEIVAKHGAQRWSSIAAHLPGRAGKQCRERCAPGPPHCSPFPPSKNVPLLLEVLPRPPAMAWVDAAYEIIRLTSRVPQMVQPPLPRGEEGLLDRGGGPCDHGERTAVRHQVERHRQAHAWTHRQRHQE